MRWSAPLDGGEATGWRSWPPRNRVTDIYLPAQVARDFREYLGVWEHLTFLEQRGLVRLVELADGEAIELGGCRIAPFRLKQDYVYAFLVTEGKKRVLIAPDELFEWKPPEELEEIDLAVIPMGVLEINPITNRRSTPHDHPVLQSEATFEQTLEMVRTMRPKRTVLTHIEEPDQISVEELGELEEQLKRQGLPISFAYDTMTIEV